MMRETQQIDYSFPLASFLAQRAAIQTDRQELARARTAWRKAREAQDEATAAMLDEQFRTTFEALQQPLGQPYTPALAAAVDTLQGLVAQGASAQGLSHHELKSFNLAMAIQYTEGIQDDAVAAQLHRVVRLAIVADANLHAQKAYVGNGGCTCLEWLMWYLSGSWHKQQASDEQLQRTVRCYYTIFPWVLEADLAARPAPERADGAEGPTNPLISFLTALRVTAIPPAWQETILVRLMAYDLTPVLPGNVYTGASFFKRIADVDVRWLGLLFPYEQEPLRAYIRAVKAALTTGILQDLMNTFASSSDHRKYFRTFFSQPHWLLARVVDTAPEVIFNLVKRNEQDLLKPFVKQFRPALLAMRDAEGNTLLHAAVMAPGVMKNMVMLLLQSGFPRGVRNDAQVTPGELAATYKRRALIPLL